MKVLKELTEYTWKQREFKETETKLFTTTMGNCIVIG